VNTQGASYQFRSLESDVTSKESRIVRRGGRWKSAEEQLVGGLPYLVEGCLDLSLLSSSCRRDLGRGPPGGDSARPQFLSSLWNEAQRNSPRPFAAERAPIDDCADYLFKYREFLGSIFSEWLSDSDWRDRGRLPISFQRSNGGAH
jgi:hypothetical protein